MWNDRGLELMHDITASEKAVMWQRLTDPDNSTGAMSDYVPNLNHWLLRARLNSHLHYEIYLIVLNTDITVDYVQTLFKQQRDAMVNLIRQRGTCLYSAEHSETAAPQPTRK
jgi:hypothetical protein